MPCHFLSRHFVLGVAQGMNGDVTWEKLSVKEYGNVLEGWDMWMRPN
jgi:hypothetical protein